MRIQPLAFACAVSIVALVCATGCSDSGSSGPSSTDSGAASETAVADTGTPGESGAVDTGGTVTAPQTDLTFEADFIGKDGPHFIAGTVTLPAAATAGRTIQFEVIRTDGFGGNQLGAAGMTKAGGTMTYKVIGLEAGTYKIGIRVDQTNNGMVNDPGDYIGFARGTASAPKTTSAAADAIVVAAPVLDVDLALGVVP